MKLSLVAADVNRMSEGTPSLAWMLECTLMHSFFFPVFGWRPTPLIFYYMRVRIRKHDKFSGQQ